ncbi:MAG TPA: TonB-dependent receptor plug domain-containing protein [Chitinophagaceae bacterium]|nr:TonB-dependent receptor plug domain-containing protein [Chitinophagaceae bacterium]
MNRPAASLLALCLTGWVLSASAQQEKAVTDLFSHLVRFFQARPQEKLYIQTDKSFYQAGEPVWFSLYNVDANTNRISNISKKVYIQLIDRRDSVIGQLILNTLMLQPFGSIPLPDSLASGIYFLRAATQNQLQTGGVPVFTRPLLVSNAAEKITVSPVYLYRPGATLPDSVRFRLTDPHQTPVGLGPVQITLYRGQDPVKTLGLTTTVDGTVQVPVDGFAPGSLVRLQYKRYGEYFTLPDTGTGLDVRFLPEGGQVINGSASTVAFRATDAQGRGVPVTGYLKTDRNDRVVAFKARHAGMGLFSFFPDKYRRYTAVVQWKDREYQYPLPPFDPFAYQLSVTQRNRDGLVLRVALGDSLYGKNKVTRILGMAREKLVFSAQGNDMYEVYVPLKDVPQGIVRFTLFTEDNRPVSERLVFVSRPQASVSIRPDKDNYRAREKITLDFTTLDSLTRASPAAFSVAVTDADAVPDLPGGDNILSNLLLCSDLHGRIEDPGYYFDDSQPGAQDDLDLVMLTHGWSRYNWEDVLLDRGPGQRPRPDSSLQITGQVLTRSGSPAPGYVVTLFHSKGSGLLLTDTTDRQGSFSFPGIDFTDSTQFILQVANKAGFNEDLQIRMDAPQEPDLSLSPAEEPLLPGQPVIRALAANPTRQAYDSVAGFRNAKILREVVIVNRRRRVMSNFDVTRRVSPTSSIITSDALRQFGSGNLKNALLTIPGVILINGYVRIGGPDDFVSDATSEPIVVIDGVPMQPDTSGLPGFARGGVETILNSIDPNTIDFIEVLKGPDAAIYGVRGGHGAILINTRRSSVQYHGEDRRGIEVVYPQGYYRARSFYMPAYDNAAARNNPAPDFRTTIYWNGRLVSDAQGHAQVSFFAADPSTHYEVTVEGITRSGNVFRKTIRLSRTD